MTKLRDTFFLVVVCVTMVACNPHKKTLADASSLRQAGMHQDAFTRYLSIYRQDPSVTEALIGLRETGNVIVNRRFSEVQMLHGQGRHSEALTALSGAESFLNENRWLDLKPPFYANGLREEINRALARQHYANAEAAVKNERWSEAREQLASARRFDRNLPEIEYLDRMIRILPDFRKGEKAMELRLYQEAYGFFEKASQIDADFRNVLILMDECVRLGRITATVIQINRDKTPSAVDRSLITSVKQNILQSNNPFIRLVARDDLDFLLEEQRNSMSGAFDESAVIEAGRLLGAEYVILGELLRYDLETEIVRQTQQKGYAGRNILARKVEYTEIESRRSLNAVYRYYLVRSETAEVVAAENIPFFKEEVLHWAEFDGDHNSLHPGNWNQIGVPSLQDRVFVDQKYRLDQLLRANATHTPGPEFEREFVTLAGVEVAERINAYALQRRIAD
jgi:tetratricopeptide (TPR) repeat protein